MTAGGWLRNPLRREGVLFVIVLAGCWFATSYFTSQVLLPVWESGGIVTDVYDAAVAILGSSELLQAALVGVWLGLVVVWMADTYKQLQTPILFALVSGFLWSTGFSVPAFLQTGLPAKAGLVGLFAAVVVQVGGIPLTQARNPGPVLDSRPREYRRAPRATVLVLATLIGVCLYEAFVLGAVGTGAGSTGMFTPALSGGALLALFGWIAVYDNRVRIMLVGPARSGKTSLVGGLYSDVAEDSFGTGADRGGEISRQVTDNRLQGVKKDIVDSRRFPDRTGEEGELQFNYYQRNRIFRKKNTISTMDYPGEDLTGGENGARLSERVEIFHQENPGSSSTLRWLLAAGLVFLGLRERTRWANLTRAAGDSIDRFIERLVTADVIVFLVPLDDFLATPIRDGADLQPYADVHVVEREGDGEYTVTHPDGERQRVERVDGRLLDCETGEEVTGLTFESFEDLHEVTEGVRYHVDKERADRHEYLSEYADLISELEGTRRREYVWTVTMTDLGLSHFEEAYSGVYQDVIGNGATNSHLEFLVENGFFDTEPSAATDTNDYKALAEWLQTEFIEREYTGFEAMMNETREGCLYPVWFNIENRDDDGLRLRDSNEPTLKSSAHVLNRIEGSRLDDGFVTKHPDFSRFRTVWNQISPLGGVPVPSATELSHEVMYERLARSRRAEASTDASGPETEPEPDASPAE